MLSVQPELALVSLYKAVYTRLAAENTKAAMSFGWSKVDRRQTLGHRRIVWVPGDDSGWSLFDGTNHEPRETGHIPRHLANLRELCTVYCEAADITNLESEVHQYTEARLLFDAWYRAAKLDSCGSFGALRANWVVTRKANAFGGAIRCVFFMVAAIPDVPLGSDPTEKQLDNLDSAEIEITAEVNDNPPEEPTEIYSETVTILPVETST